MNSKEIQDRLDTIQSNTNRLTIGIALSRDVLAIHSISKQAREFHSQNILGNQEELARLQIMRKHLTRELAEQTINNN